MKTQMMGTLAPVRNVVMVTLWRVGLTTGDAALKLGSLVSARRCDSRMTAVRWQHLGSEARWCHDSNRQ